MNPCDELGYHRRIIVEHHEAIVGASRPHVPADDLPLVIPGKGEGVGLVDAGPHGVRDGDAPLSVGHLPECSDA